LAPGFDEQSREVSRVMGLSGRKNGRGEKLLRMSGAELERSRKKCHASKNGKAGLHKGGAWGANNTVGKKEMRVGAQHKTKSRVEKLGNGRTGIRE